MIRKNCAMPFRNMIDPYSRSRSQIIPINYVILSAPWSANRIIPPKVTSTRSIMAISCAHCRSHGARFILIIRKLPSARQVVHRSSSAALELEQPSYIAIVSPAHCFERMISFQVRTCLLIIRVITFDLIRAVSATWMKILLRSFESRRDHRKQPNVKTDVLSRFNYRFRVISVSC